MPDPLDALRLPVVAVEPRPQYAAALLRRIRGQRPPAGHGATVRYFVTDLDTAVAFYRDYLGFEEELVTPPAFAMLYRGDLRLLLSVPGGAGAAPAQPSAAPAQPSAAPAQPSAAPAPTTGPPPGPGGSNRIALRVADLAGAVSELQQRGASFRSTVPTGVAVRQVLVEDPSGNLVELFEPAAGYHERGES